MPLYSYRCLKCGHIFDALRKMSDAPPPCKVCAEATEKQLTAPGSFDLRGGGYYVTDFK